MASEMLTLDESLDSGDQGDFCGKNYCIPTHQEYKDVLYLGASQQWLKEGDEGSINGCSG